MSKDSIASHYKGEEGDKYATGRDQNILNHLGYELQRKFYTPYLKKTMNVLDFGCGNGSMIKSIEPFVNSIEGVEINQLPRELAINEQKLTVFAGLDDIPEGKQYDVIVSNHVLEHIPNVIETLSILRSRLVPGGLFITMLPIEDFRTKANREWSTDDINHHLHSWAPLQFGNTLVEAGFQPKILKVITHAWSHKLFFLGEGWLQSLACNLLSRYLKRRQLLCVAENIEG